MKDLICRLLRVPPEPQAPPGAPPRIFRAAPNYLRLQQLVWCIGSSFLLLVCVGATLGAIVLMRNGAPRPAFVIVTVVASMLWIVLLLEVVVGLFIVRLNFEMRWYMVSDRAMRVREGIWVVREKTIALANVQNIAIRQGPVQRLFGIADVEVRTAGGGGESAQREKGQVGEPMHIGYFRGVENAGEIRDVISGAARRHGGAGLGDQDDRKAAEEALPAARQLLNEARALRKVLEQR